MADPTPRNIVSSKCIAYSDALLRTRRAVLTDQEAHEEGQELFSWFVGAGALTDERAVIAAECVDLGITNLKNSVDSYDTITGHIKANYQAYTRGL